MNESNALVKGIYRGPERKHVLRIEDGQCIHAEIGEEVELTATQAWNFRDRFEFPPGYEPPAPAQRRAYVAVGAEPPTSGGAAQG